MSGQSVTASPRNQSLTRPSPQYSDKPRSSQNLRAQMMLPIVEEFQVVGVPGQLSGSLPQAQQKSTFIQDSIFKNVVLREFFSKKDEELKGKNMSNPSEKAKKKGQNPQQEIQDKGSFQITNNIVTSSSSNNSTASTTIKLKKVCQNQFCPKDKGLLHLLDPDIQYGRGKKQVRLENTGEKVIMCDPCSSRYLDLHYCWFCQQVYFDEYNIDEKEWIQCDSCDRWTHLNCENETIKKAFNMNSSENIKYECPRCRDQAQKELSKQTIANQKKLDKSQAKLDKKTEKQESLIDEKQQLHSTVYQSQQSQHKQEKHLGSGNQRGQKLSTSKQEPVSTPSMKRTKVSCRADEESTANIHQTFSTHHNAHNIYNQNNSENEMLFYSLEAYKKCKKTTLPASIIFKTPPPSFVLYGYSTLEDLLKSNGLSLSLDEQNIKNDLSQLKKLLIDSPLSPQQTIEKAPVFTSILSPTEKLTC